jgi:hypothetical protein
MNSGNAALQKTFFAILWDACDHGTFEFHQPRPINSNLIRENPFFFHAPIPIEDLCGADEHLLGVTPAQRAGTSERSRINDGNLLIGLAAPHGHG